MGGYWSEREIQRRHERQIEKERQQAKQRLEDDRQFHNWQIQEANERAARKLEEDRAFNEQMLLEKQEEARKLSERATNALCVDSDGEKILGGYGGDLMNGVPQGKGTLLYDDGDTYEGEFLGGKFHGKGVSTRNDGNIRYDGEWRNGKFHGEGIYYYSKGDPQNRAHYQGRFFNGVRVGKGVLMWKDGTSYEGDFEENKMSGQGVMKWPCGDVYEGEFANGTRNGYGKYTSADGYSYEGQWKDGKREGEGKTTYPDGWSAECVWRNDTPYTGETRQYADDGETLLYEGDIVEGKKQGRGVIYCTRQGRDCFFKGEICNGSWQVGTLYYANGNIWYDGTWRGTSYYGKGTEYDEEGHVLRQGTFENSKLHGEKGIFNHYVNGKLHITKNGTFANDVITDGVLQEGKYRAEGKFNEDGAFIFGALYKNDCLILRGDLNKQDLNVYQNGNCYACIEVANREGMYLCKYENDILFAHIHPDTNLSAIFELQDCIIEDQYAVCRNDTHQELYALDGSHYLQIDQSSGEGELHFDGTRTDSLKQYKLPYSDSRHLVLRGNFVNKKLVGAGELSDGTACAKVKENATYVDGVRDGEFTWHTTDQGGKEKVVRGEYQNGRMLNVGTIIYDGKKYEGHINALGDPDGLGIMTSYTKKGKVKSRVCGLWRGQKCHNKMSSIIYKIRMLFDKPSSCV